MATAKLVVTQGNGATGSLFEGITFFLVQRLPLRSGYIKDIESNGGRIVKLEDQADHVIADHMRKDSPAGSISYTFIDHAIKHGELPDPADHPAAQPQGTVRPVGSSAPSKGTRTAFTHADDVELYEWVQQCVAKGKYMKGNEIYKQLEERNPRHTTQSWRDRYIKYLANKPPAGVRSLADVEPVVKTRTPFTPEDDEELDDWVQQCIAKGLQAKGNRIYKQLEQKNPRHTYQAWRDRYINHVASNPPAGMEPESEGHASRSHSAPERRSPTVTRSEMPNKPKVAQQAPTATQQEPSEVSFTADEFIMLLENGDDIENVADDKWKDSWAYYAQGFPRHSAEAWQKFYETQVRPKYLATVARGDHAKSSTKETKQANAPDRREASTGRATEVSGSGQSSSSQTRISDHRKRESPTDHADITHPSKKQRLSGEDTQAPDLANGAPSVSTPVQLLQADTEPVRNSSQMVELFSDEDEDEGNDEKADDGVHNKENVEHSLEIPDTPLISLTEANLATQQAQHAPAAVRGKDIPEDDEMQDQTEYAKYLQDLVGNVAAPPSNALNVPPAPPHQEQSMVVEVEDTNLFSEPMAVVDDQPVATGSFEDLFDATIHYPESPEGDRSKEVGQERFETQIDYPTLPPFQDENEVFDSQLQDAEPRENEGRTEEPETSRQSSPPLLADRTHSTRATYPELGDDSRRSETRHAVSPDMQEVFDQPFGSFDTTSAVRENGNQSQRNFANHTQNLLHGENQRGNLSMSQADDDSDGESEELPDNPMVPRPVQITAKTQSQFETSQKLQDDDAAEAYIEQKMGEGFKEEWIVDALVRTSMRPWFADIVLLDRRAGTGVPTDMKEYWTEEEDRMIQGEDPGDLAMLEEKHTEEELWERMEWLEAYQGAN